MYSKSIADVSAIFFEVLQSYSFFAGKTIANTNIFDNVKLKTAAFRLYKVFSRCFYIDFNLRNYRSVYLPDLRPNHRACLLRPYSSAPDHTYNILYLQASHDLSGRCCK